jgi:hypothetical protein
MILATYDYYPFYSAILEGKDTYVNVFQPMRRINDLIRDTSDTTCFVGGGDAMWNQTAIGLEQGYSANHECCPYCLIRGDNLHSTTRQTQRTLAMAYRCAHLFESHDAHGTPIPFTCDACHNVFTTQTDIDASAPANAKQYRANHFGWSFGRPPCFDMEPIKSFCCTLHFKLSVGKLLYKFIVSDRLSRINVKILLPILDELKIHNGCGGALSPNDAMTSVKTVHLNGTEVDTFIRNVDTILDAFSPGPSATRAFATTAIDLFCIVYNSLTDPAEMTATIRSNKVKTEGRALFNHLRSWKQDDGVNYYMHYLLDHIPDQILLLPDNFPFHLTSGSGLEAQNYITKRIVRNNCNNHTFATHGGRQKPRTEQVVTRIADIQSAIDNNIGNFQVTQCMRGIDRLNTEKSRRARKASQAQPLNRFQPPN